MGGREFWILDSRFGYTSWGDNRSQPGYAREGANSGFWILVSVSSWGRQRKSAGSHEGRAQILDSDSGVGYKFGRQRTRQVHAMLLLCQELQLDLVGPGASFCQRKTLLTEVSILQRVAAGRPHETYLPPL